VVQRINHVKKVPAPCKDADASAARRGGLKTKRVGGKKEEERATMQDRPIRVNRESHPWHQKKIHLHLAEKQSSIYTKEKERELERAIRKKKRGSVAYRHVR